MTPVSRSRKFAGSSAGLPTLGFYDEPFDATPDGCRFLLKVIGERTGLSRAVLVTNWPARLKK